MEQDPTQLPRSAVEPPPLPVMPRNPAEPPPLRPVAPLETAPSALPGIRRTYPRPPSIVRHIVLLCMRPDQWAQALRYPLHVTLRTVIATIVLAALLLGINAGANAVQSVARFGADYDHRYAPLILSKGTLTGQTTAGKMFPRFSGPTYDVRVDLAANAIPDPIEKPLTIVLNQHGALIRFLDFANTVGYDKLLESYSFLAPPQDPFTIDSAGMAAYLHARRTALATYIGFSAFFAALLGHMLWVLLTSFLVIPFAQIAARQLAMPFLVAWRIGLSVTVPLIVLGTILETLDMPLHDTFGTETALTIWTAMAAGMAFWAGVLANAMFMQTRRPAPRRDI